MDSELESMLETALWSTLGFDDEYLDQHYAICDIPESFKEKCKGILEDFEDLSSDLIAMNDDPKIGHDLWLTMHGHGAGFWDGDYENGKELSDLCDKYDSLEVELIESLLNEEE